MGWANGSQIAQEIWDAVRPWLTKDQRRVVGIKLINIFENNDCDTIEEAEQLCKDVGKRK